MAAILGHFGNTAARIGPPEVWNTRIENVRKGGMPAIVDAVLARGPGSAPWTGVVNVSAGSESV